MSETCSPHHDWFNASLTAALCLGIALSYAPQLYRIVKSRSSEGFSPLFLLLGSTCSTAGILNMVTLQWGIVRCCRYVSVGSCLEMTGGIFQVGIQWALFSTIFVLYIIYYPPHLKYTSGPSTEEYESRSPPQLPTPQSDPKPPRVLSTEWRLSLISAWASAAFFVLSFLITLYLLLLLPPLRAPTSTPLPIPTPIPTPGTPTPDTPYPQALLTWATFLGVSSALLAAIQYTPQLVHTFKHKLVGALSIPTMCIQSPGSAVLVLSIALRPGTNWTSWITFAVSGVLQSCLLIMCIIWTFRQRKLGVDDFGNPLVVDGFGNPLVVDGVSLNGNGNDTAYTDTDDTDPIPGLITTPSENPVMVRKALARAVESAVGSELRGGDLGGVGGGSVVGGVGGGSVVGGVGVENEPTIVPYEVEDQETRLPVGERTPLLGVDSSLNGTKKGGRGFTSWFK